MEILGPVLVAGLTTGALYALAAIGLSLVWGSLGMLNMAHGTMLTLGGYVAYSAATVLGWPAPLALLVAVLAGGAVGALVFALVAHPLVRRSPESFETTIIIATFGVSLTLENAILRFYGGQPFAQPLALSGFVNLGSFVVPQQNVVIIAGALVLMVGTALFLSRSRAGRAIRATAQNLDAARLMGVPVARVYLQVLVLSGMLAGVCGVLVSSITQLSPTLGADPMMKAFIMCVVAGLGNLPGAIVVSFGLAVIESGVQYGAGARWGYPVLLAIVIAVLIWRPGGLFGRVDVRRL